MRTLFFLSVIVLMASGVYAQKAKPKPASAKAVYATLGGRWKATGDEPIVMTYNELLLAGGLVPSDRTKTIVGFTFTAIGVDMEPLELAGTGSKFNANMIHVIERLKPGNKVLFGNIQCRGANDSARTLPPLTVIVKK